MEYSADIEKVGHYLRLVPGKQNVRWRCAGWSFLGKCPQGPTPVQEGKPLELGRLFRVKAEPLYSVLTSPLDTSCPLGEAITLAKGNFWGKTRL